MSSTSSPHLRLFCLLLESWYYGGNRTVETIPYPDRCNPEVQVWGLVNALGGKSLTIGVNTWWIDASSFFPSVIHPLISHAAFKLSCNQMPLEVANLIMGPWTAFLPHLPYNLCLELLALGFIIANKVLIWRTHMKACCYQEGPQKTALRVEFWNWTAHQCIATTTLLLVISVYVI